jgi:hypothetical protein
MDKPSRRDNAKNVFDLRTISETACYSCRTIFHQDFVCTDLGTDGAKLQINRPRFAEGYKDS